MKTFVHSDVVAHGRALRDAESRSRREVLEATRQALGQALAGGTAAFDVDFERDLAALTAAPVSLERAA